MPEAQTPEEARDLICGIIKDAWDDFPWVGTPAPLFYDNQDANRPEDNSPFGRVVVRHFAGGLASIKSGPHYQQRFGGTVFVQLFEAQGAGNLLRDRLAWALVQAIINAPVSVTGNVRFRDATFRELESDGTYDQTNVQAGFEYDITS
jgi:hypothetical protein